MSTCQRCGRDLQYNRVTCFLCGRSIGRFHDCGCGERWSDIGKPLYVCRQFDTRQPNDCKREHALMAKHKDELRSSFRRKMERLTGHHWP